jgi:alpha-tubulin suppressor-like RCC1 family protein
VYSWGRSDDGQLGLGDAVGAVDLLASGASFPTPTRVTFFGWTGAQGIEDIACGARHSMAKGCNGHTYTWGQTDGIDGMATGHQAPDGRDVSVPVQLNMDAIPGIGVPCEAIRMAGGARTSLFLVQKWVDPI